MRLARSRADALTAVARIRALQSRATEIEAVRAVNAHRAATERHESCAEALAEIQTGWSEALQGGSFDPGMARYWYAALDRGCAEERQLAELVEAARDRLEQDRAAWHAASARSDAAREQAQAASKRLARQREEIRLAALEDRAARGTRPS